MEFLILFLMCAVISYSIGSINPAYIFGRLFRGIDIRQHGTRNAGAGNAFCVLGKVYGVITALFDALKGVISIMISYYLFRHFLPADYFYYSFLILFSGLFAILGHDFPFYLNFKGGRGAATAYGMLIFLLIISVIHTQYTNLLFIFLAAIIFLSLTVQIITESGFFTFTLTFPFLLVFISRVWIKHLVTVGNEFFEFGSILLLFALIFLVYIFIMSLEREKEKGGILRDIKFEKRKDVPEIKICRKILRVFGILLPVLYFFFAKNIILVILAVLLLLFVLVDILRKNKKIELKVYKAIYKKKEKSFSNISLFILSALITVLLFPKSIAILALSFLVFGDTFAEIIGTKFGRIKIMGKKTLEGFLAGLSANLIIGLIWLNFLPVSAGLYITGAVSASLIELIPFGIRNHNIDDNFSVAVFSALIMLLFKIFM
ncbi:glycerol-3-phosphate acyltransferase [Candidatus Woesearchaeota archaeon]|nr:glycerol-3-phosphate acyltransferase [Candidatus Woesearchaeota archaeon]